MSASPQPRLLAVDPSLTCSGWVLFSIAQAEPLSCGTLRAPSPRSPLAQRLTVLQQEMDILFQSLALVTGDVLVCEGPAPLVLNPQSALKVEHVRTMFETLARARGLRVPGRLNPRTVQTELLGLRGRQLNRKEVKTSARFVCEKMFGQKLQSCCQGADSKSRAQLSQDIVDAALLGAVAVSRVQLGMRLGTDLAELFAARTGTSRFGSGTTRGWSETSLRRRFS